MRESSTLFRRVARGATLGAYLSPSATGALLEMQEVRHPAVMHLHPLPSPCPHP